MSFLLVAIMLFGTLPVFEAAAKTSGKLTYSVSGGKVTITGCDESASGKLTIPSKIDGYPVTGISEAAFVECSDLKSVTIPDSVTNIGMYAFAGCTGLESVNIPKGVKELDRAFYGCTSLKNVTISDGLTDIDFGSFSGCSSLKNITIPDSVEYIGIYAFSDCGFKNITIPDSVTEIDEGAFAECTSLKSITVLNADCKIYDCDYTFSENAKIIGFDNSTAQKYAKKYNRDFEVHTHTYKATATTKATAAKNGSKVTACTGCGNVKSKSTIAKIKSVTLSSTSYTYNGNVKKPTVTVKDSKGNKLKSGTDYTVKYSSGRKNVGKYTVTVTFKGKYSGMKKLTFKINPKGTSISKLTAGKKQFTVNIKKQATQTTGYQVQYSTSSKMTNTTTKTYASTSKTSRTISGLKSAKTYYVRVRTYKNVKIDGKTTKFYSSWSSIKSVKTK